jgi:predicted CxxxxCH...CXXCH cytochrome family protein
MDSRNIKRAFLGCATLLALLLGALPTGQARAADMTTAQAGAHPSHTQNNGARVALACAECHAPVCSPTGSKNIVFGPLATSGGAAPTYNASTKTCSNVYCHGSNGRTVSWTYVDVSVVKPLTTECAMCHGYPPASASGHPVVTTCNGCHSSTVKPDGTVDVTGGFHLNGSLNFSGNGTGACNGCHGTSTTNGMPDYASSSSKANSHAEHSTHNCSVCHADTTTDGTTIKAESTAHMNGAFNVVPGPGASFVYSFASPGGSCSNVSCHYGAGGTWGAKWPSHVAQLGSGDVLVFSNGNTDHGAGFTSVQDCATCHEASLVAQHGSKCALCHSGSSPPANSLIGSWKRTCSEGACHLSIHDGMQDDHFMMWQDTSTACARCHDGVGEHPGAAYPCSQCHSAALTVAAVGDHLAPTTTSNALGTYVGDAAIHLTATDAGTAGVSVTWYSLDGKRWNLGTDVSVGAPASGTKAHTLAFYSADHAMNVEAVNSVAFTVQAVAAVDTTPPTTSSSFNPAANAYFRTAQTVNLTATDAGSGVKTTYYRIDSGSFGTGSAFTVSGDGVHTFSYYSVDNANNTETTHVSNSFRIDTVAPVTASTATAGATYVGGQTFTLTATDTGGSGVAGTWYKLDAGAYTAGASIAVAAPASGSASHTLSWYSVDNAGNQEATKSVAFTVQAPVVDTTPPTTTSSFNPAAGASYKAGQPVTLTAADAGSGVKSTYYKIDAGAFVQGTSFTVTGDGLHTFSYYSVDNANNTETTRVSSSFRIDTVAPTTTINATPGLTYIGQQVFSLAAADTGSGVASTSYKLDGALTFTVGTVIAVAAPASGSAAHTISWYSLDNAGNQEATKSVTFTVAAQVAAGGTTTLSFRTNASFGGWSYVTWEVHDAAGNVVNDVDGNPCTWWNDDPGHPSSMWRDYVVPAGVAYTMYGDWGPMPDGPNEDAATRDVTAAEAAPGATVTWWWY